MFATKVLRASSAAERVPMIKFIGKRTIPGKNLCPTLWIAYRRTQLTIT
jgi:hypothetical protein